MGWFESSKCISERREESDPARGQSSRGGHVCKCEIGLRFLEQ